MGHKFGKILIFVLVLLSFAYIGNNFVFANAEDIVPATSENVVLVADEESKQEIIENETTSDSEEVHIRINDDEVPLYASENTDATYLTYVGVVIIGAVLIFGGVYLFIKFKVD